MDLPQAVGVLAQMLSLAILNLESNNITSIPSNIEDLRLVGLVLDDNPDLQLNESFANLAKIKSLKVLLLRNNSLEQLPDNLEILRGLEVLELSGNNFSDAEQERIMTQLMTTKVKF